MTAATAHAGLPVMAAIAVGLTSAVVYSIAIDQRILFAARARCGPSPA